MKIEGLVYLLVLFALAAGVHELGHVIAYASMGLRTEVSCTWYECVTHMLPGQTVDVWDVPAWLQPLLIYVSGGAAVLLAGLLARKVDATVGCVFIILGAGGIVIQFLDLWALILLVPAAVLLEGSDFLQPLWEIFDA